MIMRQEMCSYILRLFCLALAMSACAQPDSVSEKEMSLAVPAGFEPVPVPEHNPMTEAKVLLGQQLFFDPILSLDSTVSCATCHMPNQFFSDGKVLSQGIKGRTGTRNTPSLINAAYQKLLFWDGGSITLEHQVFGPLENPTEMGLELSAVLNRLDSTETYREAFHQIFDEPPSLRGLTQSIAAYQRTLISGGTHFDSYRNGDEQALSLAEQQGLKLFEGKAGCIHCHSGFLLTGLRFENNGISISMGDSGRARITGLPEDYGKFKVPSLRNVSRTAPYMHDGRMSALSEVIEHYNSGGRDVRGQSDWIQPLHLSMSERADLEAFLLSLTDSSIYAGVQLP